MTKRIPLATPTMNGSEMTYINEAFATNWISPLGPNVDNFEAEIVSYLKEDVYAAALSSGTAAIHLAFKAVGVTKGDIVFCSDLTFAATCNPIIYENATPVFIDSEPDTWNMCPESLALAFKKYPNVKAVIVVNLYGTPAKLDIIAQMCQAQGVPLIEDAAESLGATLHGRQTGLFGDIGIFSFNGNKIITSSGGGMLITKSKAIAEKVRFWATQSRDAARHYQHSELGYNYRMSNISAGIGRGQLTTLDEYVTRKTDIYNRYHLAFAGHPTLSMNPLLTNSIANHWLSALLLSDDSKVNYLTILDELDKHNIEGRPIWKPMSLQPFYESYDLITAYGDKPVSHDIFSRGLCLPSDLKMTPDEQEKVSQVILSLIS